MLTVVGVECQTIVYSGTEGSMANIIIVLREAISQPVTVDFTTQYLTALGTSCL